MGQIKCQLINYMPCSNGVAQWPSGLDAGLAINRSRVRILASQLSRATLGKLLTHICLCHQAV